MRLFIIIIAMTVVFNGLYMGGLYESGDCIREFFIITAKYIIEMITNRIVIKCGKLYESAKKDVMPSNNIKYTM